ncbi:MAG: hypothetical protein HOM68_15360 [Gemmatimonadetes bacterium]|jgi:hypothetical protein|nr:hypothetical protein [Gemmatimonadota bacterium]MBT4610621.1 hypothetical protein [Gemmatimonadota bacterium]MBT5057920.1 hypothetical protein [Gemmatimonadota bacterium]MBT5144360.1 hypothetical protein [Gemmatimonadota bacterium]MBT5587122.1 hypothetical protein [Gemmatimonadota bacterium]
MTSQILPPMIGASALLAVLHFTIWLLGIRDRVRGHRPGDAPASESADLVFCVLCLMANAGMLWHAVSPQEMMVALPIGLILATLLIAGYFQSLFGWPLASSRTQQVWLGVVVTVVLLAVMTSTTHYAVIFFSGWLPMIPLYAVLRLGRREAWVFIPGSVGCAVAFVTQAMQLLQGEIVVVYPVGLLCLYLASVLFLARGHAAAITRGEQTLGSGIDRPRAPH